MSDMLVKLYNLPDAGPAMEQMKAEGVVIRQAMALDYQVVKEWIDKTFSPGWGNEFIAAMSNRPISCILATKDHHVVGFACYDTTKLGIFGPTGVDESLRGKGIGKALCLAAMHAMVDKGYAYAVIGWAGPKDFYAKQVGATIIEGSEPGMYADMLKPA
ncbi:MAG: GNAT family N-acetyltransferase [Phycisphaeraceae bacterium]|nr:GNAT family N-acetyltransferase [Phycisphaeraceae bacterium]